MQKFKKKSQKLDIEVKGMLQKKWYSKEKKYNKKVTKNLIKDKENTKKP